MKVFLMSSERTGSNLLRVMFDTHPEICAPTPIHMIDKILSNVSYYGDLSQHNNSERMLADVMGLISSQVGSWIINDDDLTANMQDELHSFESILDTVYGIEAAKRNKKHLFIKDNGVIHYPFAIRKLFPDSKIIYLVRDVRDVVLSWKKSPSHSGTIRHATRVWAEEQRRAMRLYAVEKDRESNIKIVAYEELVSNPEYVLSDICKFLNIEYSDQMLKYFATDESINSAKASSDWQNLSSPVMSNNIDKYKDELSKRQLNIIECIARNEMRLLNYDLVSNTKCNSLANNPSALLRSLVNIAQLLLTRHATLEEKKSRIKRLLALTKMKPRRDEIHNWRK